MGINDYNSAQGRTLWQWQLSISLSRGLLCRKYCFSLLNIRQAVQLRFVHFLHVSNTLM